MSYKISPKLVFTMLILGACWSIVYIIPFIQYTIYWRFCFTVFIDIITNLKEVLSPFIFLKIFVFNIPNSCF